MLNKDEGEETYWRQIIRMLKDKYPISVPISIHRKHIPKKTNANGTTTFNGSKIQIIIDSSRHHNERVHDLLHEWGHALAIDEAFSHKGRWGTLHGEIIDGWEKWNDEFE
jgi:Zn-dependent peptidase ImmA (M78 family)